MPPIETLVLITAVFLAAGCVKGIVGMGLPTVVMGALSLSMPPAQAAALLVVPSLVTNVWQLVTGPAVGHVLRRLAVMMVCIGLGTALGIGFLTGGDSRWPSFALGAVLAVYALTGLYLPRLDVPARHERLLGPIAGGLTGVLAGATGVFVVPAVPYISALGFTKDELIQALGLSFAVSTLALAVGLGAAGAYTPGLALGSAAAVAPAVAGMAIGQAVRDRLNPANFRRWFFVSMLVVGVYMAWKAL